MCFKKEPPAPEDVVSSSSQELPTRSIGIQTSNRLMKVSVFLLHVICCGILLIQYVTMIKKDFVLAVKCSAISQADTSSCAEEPNHFYHKVICTHHMPILSHCINMLILK